MPVKVKRLSTSEHLKIVFPKKYYILMRDVGFKEVKGKPVYVSGWEYLDLFIHGRAGGWTISDGKTGGSLICGRSTQKKLIVELEILLSNMTHEFVKKRMEVWGHSPRYK